MKRQKSKPVPEANPIPAIDAKAITAAVTRPEKMKVTLFLETAVYKEFQANCRDAGLIVSDVAQQLLRSFNDSYKR